MRKPIGAFLVERKVLTQEQVEEIIDFAKAKGLRFGEAGMELGHLTRENLIKVFGPHYTVDFFYVNSKFFPEITRGAFQVDQMLQFGILPLGYKTQYGFLGSKKLLNVGFLNPDKEKIAVVESIAHQSLGDKTFAGLRVYLILADQFVDALKVVYGVSEPEIQAIIDQKTSAQVDETLQMFLQSS